MLKILIAGDSYASDWHTNKEWWKQLPYDITNIAQAGSSQYRILKSLPNLEMYDVIIIAHTSPYRIYTEHNLLHQDSITHKDSDYLIGDVIDKGGDMARAMKKYVEYFHNDEYVMYQHRKICDDIINKTKDKPTLNISGFDYSDIYQFNDYLHIPSIVNYERGKICHMNETTNITLSYVIEEKIKNLTS